MLQIPTHSLLLCWLHVAKFNHRADSRFAHRQRETALHCNDVSHWLGASLESALQSWLGSDVRPIPLRSMIRHGHFSVYLRGFRLSNKLPIYRWFETRRRSYDVTVLRMTGRSVHFETFLDISQLWRTHICQLTSVKGQFKVWFSYCNRILVFGRFLCRYHVQFTLDSGNDNYPGAHN